ncbi:MAG: hypothetical protein ABI823_10520 [Bryobacteraceae bacterium]
MRALLCFVLCAAPALAQQAHYAAVDSATPKISIKLRWLRRATLAASCATSIVLDTWSTRSVHAAGGVETNGLFRSPGGEPNWGRIIGFKMGACAAGIVLQETSLIRRRETATSAWTAIGVNSIHSAIYSATTIHNFRLAGQLRSQPGTPR